MNARYRLARAQRRVLLSTPSGWIACGFGSGLAPKAQGTCGSLAALLPWLALRLLPWPAYLLVLALAFALGCWACGRAGRALGVDDHRSLVWDEFVGQWLALLPLAIMPVAGTWQWAWVALGFALFRLFDVWKPWPIGWLDRRVKGGTGVMLDDVVAGIFAAIVMVLCLRF